MDGREGGHNILVDEMWIDPRCRRTVYKSTWLVCRLCFAVLREPGFCLRQKQERRPGCQSRTAFGETRWCGLLGDAICALASGILGGLDLLAALAGQDTNEAADRMMLPGRGVDDLG